MGVFFYTKSVALIEDVPLSEEYIGESAENDLRRDIDTGFQQVSVILIFDVTLFIIHKSIHANKSIRIPPVGQL